MMIHTEIRELYVGQKKNILDLSEMVNEIVFRSGIREGRVLIQSLHTTCALALQEAEPCLLKDFQRFLKRFCSEDQYFLHDDFKKRRDFCSPAERKNCAAHLKCFFLPSSLDLIVKDGKVLLGKFQRILFLDLDSKRRKKRTVAIQIEGTGRTLICIEPIGFVKNKQNRDPKRKSWSEIKSEIILKPEWSQALDGIEEYSHLVIVYWFDKISDKGRKRKKISCARVDGVARGIFATRAPFRPNLIGITTVRLIKRRENILEVLGLDAFNGSPVLDIKPYTGNPKDSVLNPKIPAWALKLQNKEEDECSK